MINIEQNYSSSESVALSLIPSAHLCDKYSVFLNKGRSMDEPSRISQLSHEQLVIEVAQKKDRKAFKILFEYFAPRLKSYLLNFKIADQKAEDLAQEVMITLWQKADKFDAEKAKLSTWLFRVARNKYIDLVRKQKYPELNADDLMSAMVAPEQTDKSLEDKQSSALIKEAMKLLNDDQRRVIELSFFKELSHSQIAEETGLPLGTVKSRIRTAFQTLRKELGELQ
ncbi:MAG: sigma-70 family RNA polymerase sigma factor [Emcibacteraceae bacterium]|nr:sigma-70 family RNA polymerase sigma factor [Emcibacteraceae bacterium]